MTLTNQMTILGQIGAVGGASGYRDTYAVEVESGRRTSIARARYEMANRKYTAACLEIGRPAFAQEIADVAGTSKSVVLQAT